MTEVRQEMASRLVALGWAGTEEIPRWGCIASRVLGWTCCISFRVGVIPITCDMCILNPRQYVYS